MTRLWCICFTIFAATGLCYGVSTKMDFGEEDSIVTTNSTKVEDDDVEVKHTIVVSTKLKNNNRRGLRNNDDGSGTLSYHVGRETRDDSEEVPVVNGYKSVETTQIRTPDTRYKHKQYPDSVFINRNVRDELDVYPNYVATNPSQWKPSTFYNNINWMSPDTDYVASLGWKNRPAYQTPGKFHRRISDDGVKDFYCKKCMELSRGQGVSCTQDISRSNLNNKPWIQQTTTPKIKIDGKLAKLN